MKGIIYYQSVPTKLRTKHSTFRFWKVFISAFVKNRPYLQLNKWISHHNNACSHTTLLVKRFLPKNENINAGTSTILA
jgi:hypothetical protein